MIYLTWYTLHDIPYHLHDSVLTYYLNIWYDFIRRRVVTRLTYSDKNKIIYGLFGKSYANARTVQYIINHESNKFKNNSLSNCGNHYRNTCYPAHFVERPQTKIHKYIIRYTSIILRMGWNQEESNLLFIIDIPPPPLTVIFVGYSTTSEVEILVGKTSKLANTLTVHNEQNQKRKGVKK